MEIIHLPAIATREMNIAKQSGPAPITGDGLRHSSLDKGRSRRFDHFRYSARRVGSCANDGNVAPHRLRECEGTPRRSRPAGTQIYLGALRFFPEAAERKLPRGSRQDWPDRDGREVLFIEAPRLQAERGCATAVGEVMRNRQAAPAISVARERN